VVLGPGSYDIDAGDPKQDARIAVLCRSASSSAPIWSHRRSFTSRRQLQRAPAALRPPRVTPVVAKAAGSRVPPTAAAMTSTAASPPRPGAPVTAHPGSPGTASERTAALPSHIGEVGLGERATSRLPPPTAHPVAVGPGERVTTRLPPPIEHGGAPTAPPGAAGPANLALLPPPSGVTVPHRLPPSPANAAHPAAPPAHPVQPAASHPSPAPGGKPVPKEKGKQEEVH
jgi:hypothetical protein